MTPLEPEQFDEDFTGAILMCPVCSTPTDATQWGLNEIECEQCESSFSVVVDPAKVAQHSIV